MSQSAVQFAGDHRAHIGLAVSNMERSRAFYERLFHTRPTKILPGYARFELASPSLNLSLIQTKTARNPANSTTHFGIQVKSTTMVDDARRRLETAGLETRVEQSVSCCYSVQDKVWISDPDGNRWEVYVLLADSSKPDEADCGCVPGTNEPEACCSVDGQWCCSE